MSNGYYLLSLFIRSGRPHFFFPFKEKKKKEPYLRIRVKGRKRGREGRRERKEIWNMEKSKD